MVDAPGAFARSIWEFVSDHSEISGTFPYLLCYAFGTQGVNGVWVSLPGPRPMHATHLHQALGH